MLQAFLLEPGRIELKETILPEPSDGEVVVRVKTALTCGTDLKAYIRGHPLIPMPGPFGHEYSGYIERTGRGVKGFKEGDPVMGVHSAPCLECRYCERGLFNLCENIMETKALGAFAEYILLPRHIVSQNLYHKPVHIGFEHASLLEPLSCVVHPYRVVLLDGIESALVIGTGAIGLMHIAYLRLRGVKVFAMDISEERRGLASRMGAEVVRENEAVELREGLGMDLVVECTGKEDVWQRSVDYLRRGGRVILFGGCPHGSRVSYDTHRLHYDEITLHGSFHYTPEDVREAFKLITEQRLDLSPLLSGEFTLRDITEAFRLLKQGKGIKYIIRP
jgi:L-iditol 2-dehydrogenase